MKLEIYREVLKNSQIPNFVNMRPVGAELFRADGRTDMKKLIVGFRNFRERA
jgi:hypothetical protein